MIPSTNRQGLALCLLGIGTLSLPELGNRVTYYAVLAHLKSESSQFSSAVGCLFRTVLRVAEQAAVRVLAGDADGSQTEHGRHATFEVRLHSTVRYWLAPHEPQAVHLCTSNKNVRMSGRSTLWPQHAKAHIRCFGQQSRLRTHSPGKLCL